MTILEILVLLALVLILIAIILSVKPANEPPHNRDRSFPTQGWNEENAPRQARRKWGK